MATHDRILRWGRRVFCAAVVCFPAAVAWAGEPVAVRPGGLLPRLALAPFGGSAVEGDSVRLGARAVCAGRPVAGVSVTVYRDRGCSRKLWQGDTDADGLIRPLVPKDTTPPSVAVRLVKDGYSQPAHIRLLWALKTGSMSVTQDSTPWISTAKLDRWSLSDGGAHVYFAWAHRAFAREVLAALVKQRQGVARLLGVAPEPMGVIVAADLAHADGLITRKGNHTTRRGVFVHGVRSWPIVATSMKELGKRSDERRELYLILAHELAENTLIDPAGVGITHKGTRWFRDGLAEFVECRVVPPACRDVVIRHLTDRIAHLKQGITDGETTVDLLAWSQTSTKPALPRYAAALAVTEQVVAKIGAPALRKILAASARRAATGSADLQAMLTDAGAGEIIKGLDRVDLRACVEVLDTTRTRLAG